MKLKWKWNETKRSEMNNSDCCVCVCKSSKTWKIIHIVYISIDCARKFSLQTNKSSPVYRGAEREHFVYVYICLERMLLLLLFPLKIMPYCSWMCLCAKIYTPHSGDVLLPPQSTYTYMCVCISMLSSLCVRAYNVQCSCVLAPFDCCCMQNYRFAIVVCCDFPWSTWKFIWCIHEFSEKFTTTTIN